MHSEETGISAGATHEEQMIVDLVRRFVTNEIVPLEPEFLRRRATAVAPAMDAADEEKLRRLSKELGLWGLDAPEEFGGHNLPSRVMVRVAEELGQTAIPYSFPPDAPNVRMLKAAGTEEQKQKYLRPYVEGAITSSIAISEPGAGADPAGMRTRAEQTRDGWVLNGRKTWISGAKDAAFTIVMARVGGGSGHAGITAFIVEKDAPGFVIERQIPMLGGFFTYEIALDECRLPAGAVLGEVGNGYGPMQLRLQTRRIEMAATGVGIALRALEILKHYAGQRVTFGVRLADRQAIQWWAADIASRIYACRMMIADVARKIDNGESVRSEASIVKVAATELAYEAVDHAMQTLGASGMTLESPLSTMWQRARVMRIYEGPSEVHRQAIARRVLN